MSRITLRDIWNSLLFDSYGNMALAAFVICVVSGIFIAIPYDVASAYDSLALISMTNPPAVFFRNMHYWSAQFFLVFTILHTLECMKGRPEVSRGKWFRLVIALLFVFFVMLSGFILKGDTESLQARRILESLFMKIPFAGAYLAEMALGKEDDLLLVYVHHMATATLFLLYVILEHAKTLWTGRKTLLIILALTTLLGFFVRAPLHHALSPVLKGPWYFIGLQELLHWTGTPGWTWAMISILLGMVFAVYDTGERTRRSIYRMMITLTAGYLLLVVTGFYFRGENWQWEPPWSKAKAYRQTAFETGFLRVDSRFQSLVADEIPSTHHGREGCIVCHDKMEGFSPAHDPSAIGCSSCHLGNPLSPDKRRAHKDMVLIPGNLVDAGLTCGTTGCHPGIPERINASLMTTNSGIVSVDRWAFGESSSPDEPAHIKDLAHTAADSHLRNLCAHCHLGSLKTEPGPVDQLSRGGGCNACHLNHTPEAAAQLESYRKEGKSEEWIPTYHPSLDIQVSNDHCFGCHSRSGRISTNYEGWHETLLEADDVTDQAGYRVLQDQRVFEYVAEDVHHKAGLACIDCHPSYDVMGDGTLYTHEEEAVKISCEDCHFSEKPLTIGYEDLEEESRKIFDLRKYDPENRKMIRIGAGGTALVNTQVIEDSVFLYVKQSGKILPLNPPSESCTREHAHQRLSCSACHSAWAPTCIGCHNAFERETEGYDLLENRPVKGTWVEYVGTFEPEMPALGISTGRDTSILPAIPGMIMSIDKRGFSGTRGDSAAMWSFHRLYAPVAPHTTSREGRNCKSCHNNPLSLGYGKGHLEFLVSGQTGLWSFTPSYARNVHDGLPEDAWTGFLEEPETGLAVSTRTNFRPFSLAEQKHILTVGACLTCHEEESEIMRKSLQVEFSDYVEKISGKCILPEWPK